MMALLYETVPTFTDMKIEYLDYLARYRIAIEEDKEIHSIWCGFLEVVRYRRWEQRRPSNAIFRRLSDSRLDLVALLLP